jgi:hypothetical protein
MSPYSIGIVLWGITHAVRVRPALAHTAAAISAGVGGANARPGTSMVIVVSTVFIFGSGAVWSRVISAEVASFGYATRFTIIKTLPAC